MAAEGTYLYCFARAGAVRGLDVPGIDGQGAAATIEHGGVAGVTSPVSVAQFRDQAEEHSGDPQWVIPRACRHEEVVEAVLARSPVVPVRFGSVFADRAKLCELLAEQQRAIAEFLSYCSDKEEWAVKAQVDRSAASAWLAESASARPTEPGSEATSAGACYLQKKKRRYRAERRLEPWLRGVAETARRELGEYALDVRSVATRFAGQEQDGLRPAFQLALLVARRRMSACREHVAALARAHRGTGLVIESTGPWPPYHFCPAIGRADA